jgi:hypothetical protein
MGSACGKGDLGGVRCFPARSTCGGGIEGPIAAGGDFDSGELKACEFESAIVEKI